MSFNNLRLLVSYRLLAVLFLGFASGLPLALTGTTLQAWFTEAGVGVVTIGALSLIGLPYTLKFIWAPVMDYYRFPKLGTRKAWMMLTQLGLFAAILLMAHLNPVTQAYQMGMIALLIAFLSASQDISITAYQTDVLQPEERGLGSAYYIFTYRIAMLVSGGLALIFADYLGWALTYQIMAGLILVLMLVTFLLPRANELPAEGKSFIETSVAALRDLLDRENILVILAFILFYKFGDALALQLMTNFLLHGLGFSLTEVGLAYKLVSIIAMILGAFVGGIALTRWRLFNALLVFGLAQSLSTLLFAFLAAAGKHFVFMAVAVFAENFCSGLSTAALLALMMSLCDHRYSASQFALLSAFASIGRVLLGPIAGVLVAHVGWVQFFTLSFLMCLPGIYLLMLLKDKVTNYAHA